MALILADRVQDTTTTTSTGTITLSGTAPTGYQNFSVIGNGNTTYYTIAHQTLTEWEVGIGTYTSSGTTLSRTTVLASSNAGSLVVFSAGTKDVFVTYPAERSVNLSSAALTSGRVPYATTDGLLVDASTLTFNGTTFTAGVPTVISMSSSSDALRITQTGAGNALVVEDSANPDATPFVIDNAGKVLSGQTIAYATFNDYLNTTRTPQFQFSGTSTPGIMFSLANWSNLASSPATLNLAKSRGAAVGTQAVVSNGDDIGVLEFSADDGTNFVPAAAIIAEVDGTPGTNDMPGRLVFSTTANGASTPTERMRIDSAGGVGIGTTPSTATKLIVGGSLTGATTGYGVLIQPTVQPDVTSAVHLARSQMSTAANGGTPYTISNSYNYYATQGTYNADSTVTAQYGFFVSSAFTGATTNTGFYGQIASGTGRYNLYMGGTADNYMAGTLGIGTTSLGGGYGLRVTKTFSADNGSGVFSSAIGSSSTPTALFSFRSSVSTATNSGTPYTVGTVYSYYATQGTFDADSTVTTQHGYIVGSALTGATNNYGFTGQIASGTGRWNLYMGGTADNYMAGNLGIGTTSVTARRLVVGGSMTGATGAYGVLVSPTIQPDVTVNALVTASQAATAANGGTPYTVASLTCFNAAQSTFNADSTVTNQYGFAAAGSLTGATNNYGFYGNIATAANRYNFYANGTAPNRFSGDVQIFGAGGLGYTTGSGGTTTQGTSRTTGVTLNKTNGAITMFTAAGSAIAATFTVTNSLVAATDTIILNQKSGTNLYVFLVTAVAAGSFDITFYTTGGIASDAPVINFSVIKAVTA